MLLKLVPASLADFLISIDMNMNNNTDNMQTSGPSGNTIKILLVVLSIYALIALVTYLLW